MLPPADLAGEHEALLSFLYLAPVGLVQCGADGEISMLNPISAQLLMPLTRDGELRNLYTVLQDVMPDLRQLVAGFGARHGRVCDATRIALSPALPSSGAASRKPQTLALTLLKLDEMRLMAVVDDITEQVRRERLLQQSSAWFDAILTGITDYALVRLDLQGKVDGWNPGIGRVTGLDAAQVAGQPYSIFSLDEKNANERLADRLREADRDGWSVDDGWRRRADGSAFWGTALIAPTGERNADGTHAEAQGYHLIIRDISDKREATEALMRSITCDHLTGLTNRRAFFETAQREIDRWRRAPRPLSLVLFDADHFKAVNDQHGHPVGDAVLQRLATAMQTTFRSFDVVARIGGEEFAVLLPHTGVDAAMAVADRLRNLIASEPLALGGLTLKQTISGGVVEMDADTAGLEALMQRADRALYAAKAAGRNCVRRWTEEVTA